MKSFALLLISALGISAQQPGAFDTSAFAATLPVSVAATLPATCKVGQLFWITTSTAGQNLKGCTATNVWTTLTGATGGVITFNTRTGAVTLTAADVDAVGNITNSTSGTASNVTGVVAVVNGGNGISNPSLVAGTNVVISGTWPNQIVSFSGATAGVSSFNTRTGPVVLTSTDVINALGSPSLGAGANVTITGTWPNQTIASTGGGGGTPVIGTALAGATTLSIVHNFGSTSHSIFCWNATQWVTPTTGPPGLNTDTLTFTTPPLSANTTCVATLGGGGGSTVYPAIGLPTSLGPGVGWGSSYSIWPLSLGGTGTATPGLIAGTNVTITGSWPNQTISSTGSGGSGNATSIQGEPVVSTPPITNQFLLFNGTAYVPQTVTTIASGLGVSITGGSTAVANVKMSVRSVTGTSDTLQPTDCGGLVTYSNASAISVAIPQAGLGGNFLSGCPITVRNYGAGTATFTPSSSTIGGASSYAVIQNHFAQIVSDSVNFQLGAAN